jgi:putative SOS response-associated peptidase YedK
LLVVSYSPITPKERGPLGSVVLAEGDWPKLLGEALASEDELLALLKPCLDETLMIWPANQMVGNVRNNGPQLVMPI